MEPFTWQFDTFFQDLNVYLANVERKAKEIETKWKGAFKQTEINCRNKGAQSSSTRPKRLASHKAASKICSHVNTSLKQKMRRNKEDQEVELMPPPATIVVKKKIKVEKLSPVSEETDRQQVPLRVTRSRTKKINASVPIVKLEKLSVIVQEKDPDMVVVSDDEECRPTRTRSKRKQPEAESTPIARSTRTRTKRMLEPEMEPAQLAQLQDIAVPEPSKKTEVLKPVQVQSQAKVLVKTPSHVKEKIQVFEKLTSSASAVPALQPKTPKGLENRQPAVAALGHSSASVSASSSISSGSLLMRSAVDKEQRELDAVQRKKQLQLQRIEETKRKREERMQKAKEARLKKEEERQLALEKAEAEKAEKQRQQLQLEAERRRQEQERILKQQMEAERKKAEKAREEMERKKEKAREEAQKKKEENQREQILAKKKLVDDLRKEKLNKLRNVPKLCDLDYAESDSDYEERPKVSRPPWCHTAVLEKILLTESRFMRGIENRVALLVPLDLKEVFPIVREKDLHRNSSAVWDKTFTE